MDGWIQECGEKGAIEERTTTIRRLSLVRIFSGIAVAEASARAFGAMRILFSEKRGASAAGRLLVKDAKEKRERTPFEIFDGILSVICEAEASADNK